MEKLTQYRSIARFVKKAIDLFMTKRAIATLHPQDRSTFPYPQTAIALFDSFQREDPLEREKGIKGDRPSQIPKQRSPFLTYSKGAIDLG